jgi:hypothetical protein
MSFTTTDLDQLRAAYASGVLRVRFGDQEVTYKSEEDMRRTIERIERELYGKKPIKTITPKFSKGLN